MSDIRPFRALRPERSKAGQIAALPYDVYSRQEAKAEIERSPLSFLRIDRAETNFSYDVDTYDDRVYEKARELLQDMIEKGEFKEDEKPMFYIYELTMEGRTQTGIVAAASIDDYEKNIIKKHENTRPDKETDRIKHIDALRAHTGPVFLGYRKNGVIERIVSLVKEGPSEYDITASDGVRHRIWLIDDDAYIAAVRGAFDGINEIYICDGHHRCEAARKEMHLLKESGKDYEGADAFLSVLFPAEELKIYDYNRVVKDLNGLSESRFLDRIRKKFDIEEKGSEPFKPDRPHEFGMYISHCWYRLKIREDIIPDDPVDSLDVSLLQNELLSPILNIEDPRTDPRISFVGGIHGMKGLMDKVDRKEFVCAFSLFPTSIEELFSVADSNRLMPPKSTWFEPKLRSGLFIHRF